jgi:hypothetical protein
MNASARDFRSDGNDAVTWRPGKLWSLWDIMIAFDVDSAAGAFTAMVLRTKAAGSKAAAETAPIEWTEECREALASIAEIARRASLFETLEMISRLKMDFASDSLTCGQISFGFHHLHDLMKSEMRKRLFMLVGYDKVEYYSDFDLKKPKDFLESLKPRILPTSLFGLGVDQAFP